MQYDSLLKTHPTLVNQVRCLCVTLHACKGNAPVIVKKERATRCIYLCKQSSEGMGTGVYMCVLSSLHSVPRDIRVCCARNQT